FLGAVNAVVLERENIRTLLELTRSLSRVDDYAALPGTIARMAAQLCSADRCAVATLDADGEIAVRGAVNLAIDEPGPWRDACCDAIRRQSPARLLSRPADG